MQTASSGNIRVAWTAFALLALVLSSPVAARADTAPMWRETAARVSTDELYSACLDATHPGMLLTHATGRGTAAVDFAIGRRTAVQARPFDGCSEQTGWLFARNMDGTALRFSVAEPTGQTISHYPTHIAADGSPILYTLGVPVYAGYASAVLTTPGRLWASLDSGATWAERDLAGAGVGGNMTIVSIAPVEGDARTVYALVQERLTDPEKHVHVAMIASADAGATWERRYEGDIGLSGFMDWPSVVVEAVPGRAAPTTAVTLLSRPGYGGSGAYTTVSLSGDGGRTFAEVGKRGLGVETALAATSAGIVRFRLSGAADVNGSAFTLNRTGDSGATWQPLTLPYRPPLVSSQTGLRFLTTPAAPCAVFLISDTTPADSYVSRDGGTTWLRLAEYRSSVRVGTTMPLTLLSVRGPISYGMDNALSTLDFSGAIAC